MLLVSAFTALLGHEVYKFFQFQRSHRDIVKFGVKQEQLLDNVTPFPLNSPSPFIPIKTTIQKDMM